jgi:phage baseplate assembly protein W
MSRARNLAAIEAQMGVDLRLDYALGGGFFEDADFALAKSAPRPLSALDLETAAGIDNFTQAIANRLKTRQGELADLGHPSYGSRLHELLGEPNLARTRNLLKLYVLRALADEPRIARVLAANVRAEADPPRETVRIELSVLPVDRPTPLNLVIPFSLAGTP